MYSGRATNARGGVSIRYASHVNGSRIEGLGPTDSDILYSMDPLNVQMLRELTFKAT